MNRRSVFGVMVMAATLVSAQAVYAAPTAVHSPVNAIYANAKLVKFTLRNDSSAPLKLKVGDNEMTLLPGKPVDVMTAEDPTTAATRAFVYCVRTGTRPISDARVGLGSAMAVIRANESLRGRAEVKI